MPLSQPLRHDVVVVGARAAGAATALLLARLGHDVVVVDRAAMPSDTISTHQVARTGVLALHRWGVLGDVLASGAPALRQVTFHVGEESTSRPVRHRFGFDHLVAPRRHILDALLAQRATQAGAALRTGVTVTGVRLDDRGRATAAQGFDRRGEPIEIAGRFIVGADGVSSRVARSVGARLLEDRGSGGSTRYAYFTGLDWSGIEHFYGHRSLAGIFPTHDGEACVWVCTPEGAARAARHAAGSTEGAFDAELRRTAPALARRLQAARRTSSVLGMLRMPNQRRRAYGPGWALVGDAGLHRDAVSAHGMSDAFRDAELLAVALDEALRHRVDEADALAGYQDRRDAAAKEIFDLTCDLVAYPPVPRFVELMRALGPAIDTEAALMAAQPIPGRAHLCPG